jgi:hypothetical protein
MADLEAFPNTHIDMRLQIIGEPLKIARNALSQL